MSSSALWEIGGMIFFAGLTLIIAGAIDKLTEATRGVVRELHYIRRVLDKEDDYASL